MKLKIIIYCISFLIVLSCSSQLQSKVSLNKEIKGLKKTTLLLPDILFQVHGDSEHYVHLEKGELSFIIWFSNESCSECTLYHLEEYYYNIWRLSKDTGHFRVLFIFSPNGEEEKEKIVDLIKVLDFEWPIFLDMNNDMETIMPQDSRLHMLLVNANGFPIYFGNPLMNGVPDQEFMRLITSSQL